MSAARSIGHTVVGGRNSDSDADLVTAPASEGVVWALSTFMARHAAELDRELAVFGLDHTRLLQPEWRILPKLDDLRLHGSIEERRRLVARLIADISAETQTEGEQA